MYSKLLYYSNFLLFPILTLNHIDSWLCTSGLKSLKLLAITGTSCWTVGQDVMKIAKPNLKKYVTPGLYIRSMHVCIQSN